LRTNEERLLVKAYLHFMLLVEHHMTLLTGNRGHLYRKEYQRELGLPED
jgi:hypothetical protein